MTRAVAFADLDVADLIQRRFVPVRVSMWHHGPAAVSPKDRARLDALGFVSTDRVPRVPDILVLAPDLSEVARIWSFADADTVLAVLAEAAGEPSERHALGADPAGRWLAALRAEPGALSDVTAWITTHGATHSHLAPVAALLRGEALARQGDHDAAQAVFARILTRWPDTPTAHRARFHRLNFDVWPIPPLPEVRGPSEPSPPRPIEALRSAVREVHAAPDVLRCSQGMLFRRIPAGRFTMGTDHPRFLREGPAREVILSASYCIGVWPVTRREWMTMEPDRWPGVVSDSPEAWCPALGVSWTECQQLIEHLNAQSDWRYRLPTEAEWARAAAGGRETRFPWGDDLDLDRCNLHRSDPVPVACFAPNGFGLYDVIGNGLEWVADAYAEDALSRLTDGVCDPFVGPDDPGVLQPGLRVQRSMFPAPRSLVRHLGDRVCRTYGLEEQGFGGRGVRLVAVPPQDQ